MSKYIDGKLGQYLNRTTEQLAGLNRIEKQNVIEAMRENLERGAIHAGGDAFAGHCVKMLEAVSKPAKPKMTYM